MEGGWAVEVSRYWHQNNPPVRALREIGPALEVRVNPEKTEFVTAASNETAVVRRLTIAGTRIASSQQARPPPRSLAHYYSPATSCNRLITYGPMVVAKLLEHSSRFGASAVAALAFRSTRRNIGTLVKLQR
jgi:hypothetical protein